MALDQSHREFVNVAGDALAEWRPVDARPAAGTPGGAYQVYDYPPLPGATAFLFYWPASIEITFAGYLPQEAGASQRRQVEFVTHLSRLLGQLGYPVEVHGHVADHPFAALPSGSCTARLREIYQVAARNRGYLLIGLAEDNRRAGEPDDEPPGAADADDVDADAD